MVEWKPLNKIVKSISTGLNPRQNFTLNEKDASLYYVTVKEITTNKVVFSDSTDRITEQAKHVINNRSKLSKGDILFSGIGTIGKVAYVDIPTNNWDCSESVFLIKPNEMETKGSYLAYILSSDIAKNQYERGAAGAIMKGVRKATLENLLIPIPSLEEQTRIVGILDTFTASIDNLKEQIAQRRKQYEFYRDQLLDLEGKEGVEMKVLGDVCKLERGVRVVKKELKEDGIIPVYQNSLTPLGYFEKSNYPENTPFVICAGAAGEIGFSKKLFWAADDCTCVVYPSSLNGKYIYHCLKIKQSSLKSQVRKASVPRLSKDVIGKLIVPIPSLSEQQRIVSILDTFEASIRNLEAQLAQREKQYEYYRNKLLTFE